MNPRELNPYLRDNGCGYPEDDDQMKTNDDKLLSSSVVGDGGASWRLKALKRAQEQAARDGKNLDEVYKSLVYSWSIVSVMLEMTLIWGNLILQVVQERWGSLGHLTVSVASRNAAAPRAHLHAIKSRQMGACEEVKYDTREQSKGNDAKVIVSYWWHLLINTSFVAINLVSC